ncbi:MAG: flagellar hook-length control protein FliK [Rhodospirillales bacterium]|nr:flagellar hook-length control protein FliK [Rhodospirillales bacterium]
MNDLLVPVDQIRTSAAPTALFSGGGGQGASLKDQIQFSSLMKTFVDTPQEALAAAQGPAKPFDRPENAIKPSDHRAGDRSNGNHSDNQRSDGSQMRSDHVPAQDPPRAQVSGDRSRGAPDRPGGAKNKSSDGLERGKPGSTQPSTNSNPAETAGLQGAADAQASLPLTAQIAGATMPAPGQSAEAGQKTSPTSFSYQMGLQQAKINLTSKDAATQTSPTPDDTASTRMGEDLLQAVVRNSKPKTLKTTTQSASNALANQQAQILSQKLGPHFHAQINVTTDDALGKQKVLPSQTLTGNALLSAQATGGENTGSLPGAQQREGASIAPDRQALNTNLNGQNNANGNANLAHQNAAQANFAQTLQTQAQNMQQGAQAAQAAPKIAAITADAANVTSVNGPAGPSQLSQAAKANPMAPARQPQKPPVPMEQISVQIQKAIHQGNDKVNIKLNPAHLGRVEVRMDIGKDGQLSAVILAERPETLDMLQKDVRGLERALQQAGLDTNSNSFNFGLKNNGGQQAEPGHQREDGHGEATSDDATTKDNEPDAQMLSANAQQYDRNQSPNGGVDIRV